MLLDMRGGGESSIEPSKMKTKKKTKSKSTMSSGSIKRKPATKKSSSSGSVIKTKKKKSETGGDKHDDVKKAVDQALEKDSAQALGDAIRYVLYCTGPTELFWMLARNCASHLPSS
jgi:hypothetical protein